MLPAKNQDDALEFVTVMYKIMLVSFSGHGVYTSRYGKFQSYMYVSV